MDGTLELENTHTCVIKKKALKTKANVGVTENLS